MNESKIFSIFDKLIAENVEPFESSGMTAPVGGQRIGPPLEKGKEYAIKQAYVCGCGQNHIDVGLVSKYNFISCHKCGEELPNGDKIHWCHSSRFVKVD